MQSIVKITAKVERGSKNTEEERYYITSLPPDPKKILASVRSHWAIENSLHWTLNMSFNEDQSRIRKKNAPENMAVIRHIALNMLQKIQKKRQSIKLLRKSAGRDNNFLKSILQQNFI